MLRPSRLLMNSLLLSLSLLAASSARADEVLLPDEPQTLQLYLPATPAENQPTVQNLANAIVNPASDAPTAAANSAASPSLAYKDGPLSISPELSGGKLGGPDKAYQTTNIPQAETPQLNVGGSASVQLQDNAALSLDYMAGRSGSQGEAAPVTGLARDPATEQQMNVNMKLAF